MEISLGLLSRFAITTIVATLLGLGSHILLTKLTTPIIGAMTQGYRFPTAEEYGMWILSWAYITAFEQVLVTASVYYFVGDLFRYNRLLKILLLSFVLLELHGGLIRMVVMNCIVAGVAGLKHPLLFSLLSQSDKILSSTLVVSSLVLICPTKKYVFSLDDSGI